MSLRLLPTLLSIVVLIVSSACSTALQLKPSEQLELLGVHELVDGEVEIVYQLPAAFPVGVLAVFHGCQHSATDWWPRTESCPQCTGLPVERAIVAEAVRRGYLVVAVSSSDREFKCWEHRDEGPASRAIAHVYDKLIPSNYDAGTEAGSGKPLLFLLGASSGGGFLYHLGKSPLLPEKVRLAAMCVQIMSLASLKGLPPTLFLMMEKDTVALTHMQRITRGLTEDQARVLVCREKPITPLFFTTHGNVLSAQDSTRLQQSFLDEGVINSDFFLVVDPRNSNHWKSVRLSNWCITIVSVIDNREAVVLIICDWCVLGRHARYPIGDSCSRYLRS